MYSVLVVTDHFRDACFGMSIDPQTGEISGGGKVISWAAGGLQSPHGLGVSLDGNTLAVTNFGDSSIRFFDSSQVVTFLDRHSVLP